MNSFRGRVRRSGALAGAALITATAAIAGAGASVAAAAPGSAPVKAKAGQVDAPVPDLSWAPCPDMPGVLCTTALAPLDYDKPNGRKVVLDLAKVPAQNQAAKLGTLFVNPGGPGGASTGFVEYAAAVLGTTIAQRYDVVGVDPRGVGKSSQIVCTQDAPPPPTGPTSPITWEQAKVSFRMATWIRTGCKEDRNAIVGHMSTADTARDMDLIRQAVGDEQLNYYGVSYGTYLGATYASLFPGRVGHFVVDGVLDPVAWATGDSLPATLPFSTRLKSAKGAYESLVSALAECDRVGPSECTFAGDAMGKWEELVAASKQGTLTYEGQPVDYSLLVSIALGTMYANNFANFDYVLTLMYNELHGNPARVSPERRAAVQAAVERVTTAPYLAPQARVEVPASAFEGVSCADTRNPQNRIDWWRAGQQQDKESPWFGTHWTWASAPCARWPIATKSDTYFGPFGGATANPILVVGNTYDPATPYHGAQAVASLFDSARLLTLDGWGHGSLENRCVVKVYDRYFADGTLPEAGAVCQPNGPLFEGSAGS